MTWQDGEGMAPKMRVKGVVALLEQAVRIIHAEEHAHGLVPAQWTALRYFANAAPHLRTTAGLMRYQNMAMSPVARTVRSLVERGLIKRKPNPLDGRSELIELTPDGRKHLTIDPANKLAALLETVSQDDLAGLAVSLQKVIQGLLPSEASDDADATNDKAPVERD